MFPNIQWSRGCKPSSTLPSEGTTCMVQQRGCEPLLRETLMVLNQLCRLLSFFVLWFLHLYNGCSQLSMSQFAMVERKMLYKMVRVILKTLVSSMQSNNIHKTVKFEIRNNRFKPHFRVLNDKILFACKWRITRCPPSSVCPSVKWRQC